MPPVAVIAGSHRAVACVRMISSGGPVSPWTTVDDVRARLAAGADPHAPVYSATPLHNAAEWGTPEAVAELARAVDDVDRMYRGRIALWTAVAADNDDNARALAAAGADPWRPMMAGWSPGRLSFAGRTPDLFGPVPAGVPGLSEQQAAEAREAHRLAGALGWCHTEGSSWSCVSDPEPDEPPDEILRTVLYRHRPVAYSCAFAGLRPADARAFTGPPDAWVTLPRAGY